MCSGDTPPLLHRRNNTPHFRPPPSQNIFYKPRPTQPGTEETKNKTLSRLPKKKLSVSDPEKSFTANTTNTTLVVNTPNNAVLVSITNNSLFVTTTNHVDWLEGTRPAKPARNVGQNFCVGTTNFIHTGGDSNT